MTFVPNQSGRTGAGGGMPVALRTALFWLMMVVLAAVLWKMAESGNRAGPSEPSSSMSYSDFMAQVDKNNVRSVKIVESPSTAEVEGELRQPPQSFRVTVPKESIPDLTERLEKQGVSIDVSTGKDANWRTTAVDILPILVIVALWIFGMSRGSGRRMRNPPASPETPTTPTVPTNRPLG